MFDTPIGFDKTPSNRSMVIREKLVHLDEMQLEKRRISDSSDVITRYISDIAGLYSVIHSGSVTVSCVGEGRGVVVRVDGLPKTSSDMQRFIKVILYQGYFMLFLEIVDWDQLEN